MDTPVQRPAVERRSPQRPLPSHRQWTPLGRALSLLGDNWTLAIVTELAAGRTRLSVLRDRLSGVSAGVLDRYLSHMAAAGLLTRTRFRETPPRVELELTDAGRELLPIVAALSRWGLRWAWSQPSEREIVDPGALLRALPLLLDEPVKAPDGTVELILDERGGRRRHLLDISGGRVSIRAARAGHADARPSARVAGDWRAWAAAFGPGADVSRLRLAGRRSQARALLAAIARPHFSQPAAGSERG